MFMFYYRSGMSNSCAYAGSIGEILTQKFLADRKLVTKQIYDLYFGPYLDFDVKILKFL